MEDKSSVREKLEERRPAAENVKNVHIQISWINDEIKDDDKCKRE